MIEDYRRDIGVSADDTGGNREASHVVPTRLTSEAGLGVTTGGSGRASFVETPATREEA